MLLQMPFFMTNIHIHTSCRWTFRLRPCVLAIVYRAAMNIWVHDSFQIMVFSDKCAEVGLVDHYYNSVFSFLRNLHTVLHSGCTNLPPHQQGLFLHPLSSIYYLQTFWWWPFWLVWGIIPMWQIKSQIQRNGRAQVLEQEMVITSLRYPFCH